MKRLRIAVDARELSGHVTGVGSYLMGLLPHWLARDDVDVTLISHRPLAAAVEELPGIASARRIVRRGRKGGTLWEQTVLPRAATRAVADVLFAPAYTAPLASRLPVVVAIHDVSFVARPGWFRRRERLRRAFVTKRSARRAAAVVTISEFSAREIAARLGIEREKIHVIPPAAPTRSATAALINAREPVIVYVGSIFNRRRLPDVIAAFAGVARARPGARLVIAGANRTWPRQNIAAHIARSGAASHITWLERATNAEVSAVLDRAAVSIFLSEYEGFALTPLEGLAHGMPPVLLDTPVAREVYGGAAVFVQKGDITGTVQALTRLLDRPAERASLVAAAHGLWTRYDGATAARDALALLRSAAR